MPDDRSVILVDKVILLHQKMLADKNPWNIKDVEWINIIYKTNVDTLKRKDLIRMNKIWVKYKLGDPTIAKV